MRKITSLLMLLCMFVGTAWGQSVAKLDDLSNDKVYVLKSGRTTADASHYLLYHTDAPNNLSSTYSGQGHKLDYNAATQNFHFAIYKHEGKFYFYNIAAGKFIGNNDNNNGAIPLVEKPTNSIEIRSSNDKTYNFVLSTNGKGALNAADTDGCHGVVNWTGGYSDLTDGGNIYQIIEIADLAEATKAKILESINIALVVDAAQAAVDIASNTLVGAWTTASVETLTEKLNAYKEENTPDNFNALKEAYDVLLENGEKVALSEGEVFTVKCVEDSRGYMVYSTVEGKGSDTQVYLAGTNRTEYHAAINAEGVYKEWSYVEVDGKKYIFNTENEKFITSDGVVQFSEMGHAFNFVDIDNALWEIQFEANNRYLSYSPGWGANCVRTEPSVDNGCKFYIEKTDQSLDSDALVSMVDKIYLGKLNSWKDATLAVLGYVGGYPASMADDIKSVTTYSGALTFDEENETKRTSMTAGLYFIKNTGEGSGNNANWYVTYGANGTEFMAMTLAEGEKLGAKHVWSIEASDDAYKFQSCNLGKYPSLIAAGATSKITSDVAGATKFKFTHNGAAKFTIRDSDGRRMRTEDSGAINHWGTDNENDETWYLIPATELEITVGKAGWGTIYLPFDVVVPNTVEAYAVTATSKDYATLTKMEDIRAKQGAILKGEGTHTLTIADATSDWTGNKLEGTFVNTYVGKGAYVLAKPTIDEVAQPVGFYKATLNKDENGGNGETHFLNSANKAYLPASAVPAGARFLSFDFGNETAIENIEGAENAANTVIYDLSGRRVQKAQKGLYIVNGVKVIK